VAAKAAGGHVLFGSPATEQISNKVKSDNETVRARRCVDNYHLEGISGEQTTDVSGSKARMHS